MEEIWEFVQGNVALAHEWQETQANCHHRPIDFVVGDQVWLILHNYPMDCWNKKLSSQQAGPFQITEQIGNVFCLDLPTSMRIHPIFSPNKLH